jgi:hypothetical protein
MNKLKKLLVIFQILMLLWPTAFTVASTINIGDTINIERGDLGFYSIQYWNENRGMWMYKTYSRTYYTDKDGSKKIAYCMDQDLDGVGWLPGEDENYDTEVKYELKDEKIWRVLKNGYPNVSPEQLGVETEDDAYLATKQAVYWVIKYRNVEGGNAYNVYTHFRAGETEINNQNLDDIQRRGKKVIDAIYNLVNIAFWNEQEVQQDPEIVDIGQYEEDENPEYCIKRYQVTDTGIDAEVRITGIEWKSQKLLIVDENENPKTEFKPGDIIKVMIPKKEILENSKLKIYYTKTMEDFPVYYTASKIEGRQNYVILLDKTRESTGTINFDVGGDKSELQIVKIDAETSRPLEGVTFSITYEDGKVFTCTTDENGIANCKGLYQGKVVIKETATKEGYILDEQETELELGYKEFCILSFSNSHKKGEINIRKVDKDDNNINLEGVEFDIIDETGNIIDHLVTDSQGKASTTVNTGNYIVRETKTNEEYKIGEEKNVTVKWNENVELKIENEKKKGQIKIIKRDKDDSTIKLEGVKFEIQDKDEKLVSILKTDENGEAILSNIPIGNYYIKETETLENYVLNEEKMQVIVNEDSVTEVVIENEKKRGQIQITKTSEDKNNIIDKEEGSPIEGVKFNIYNKANKIVDTIVTDENGVALSKKLEKGRYTVQEVETEKWYILDEKIYNVEIKENNEIIMLDITNKSKDPKVEITKSCKNITKTNDEIDYSFEIKNTGNVELEDFTWYDYLPTEYAKITGIETGTYNKDIIYNIYYKTNQKDEYMVLKKNLNGEENNFITLSDLHLEKDEKVTEIKIYFGNVDVGFKSEKNPHIIMKTNDGLKNDTRIENSTVLEGYNLDYRVSSKDTAVATVYEMIQEKKLPRTGF